MNLESPDMDLIAPVLPGRAEILEHWLSRQPLVPVAGGMVLGIALDAAWPVPAIMAVILFLLAGIILFYLKRRVLVCHAAVILAGISTGAMLHDYSFRHWPQNHVARYCGQGSTPVRLTGTVVTAPVIRPVGMGSVQWYRQSSRTRMVVEAEKIEGVAGDIEVCGLVSVMVREPLLRIETGDRVELFGKLFRPVPPMNAGVRDWTLISQRNGILVQLTCEHAANVVFLSVGDPARHWIDRLRRWVRRSMLDEAYDRDEPGAQLLSAMVLGQRSAVEADLNEVFVRTGTVHYLSVSGAHVGMLASMVWLIGWLAGQSRRGCAFWAMLLVTAYAILAEPRPPIMRAALMSNLFCLSILLRRPARSINWLALAAIILLLIKPTQLFMPGFQLSFVTVTVLILFVSRVRLRARHMFYRLIGRGDPLLMPEIQEKLHPPSLLRNVINWTLRLLSVWLTISVTAWLASGLIVTYHFQRVAVWGWLNTLIVLPLVWFTLVLGYAKTGISVLCPPLADEMAFLLRKVTEALIAVVEKLSALPGAGMPTPQVPGWFIFGGYAVLVLWLLRDWLRMGGRYVAMAAFVLLIVAVWHLAPARSGDSLRMHVLSVGDGSCCVIQLPNGNNIIYDIGSRPPYDLERWTVGPFLAHQRIPRIDAVILSHANLDHYCGLPDLLDRRRVEKILTAPHFAQHAAESSGTKRVINEIKKHDLSWKTIDQGDRLTGVGEVEIKVLWPPPIDQLSIAEPNDTSVVLRISYAGKRILLCGDIEEPVQRYLLAMGDLKADVLVLPHHGGVVPTTKQFIEAVDPEYCIRSSGQRDKETTNGLLELVADRNYYNTADDGVVEVAIEPGSMKVTPFITRQKAKR